MAWAEKKELTEGQKKAAQFAGIPADRPGLGAEYPKAVYFADDSGTDRILLGEPLLVQGKYSVRVSTVNDEIEELEAIEQGWALSPDLEAVQRQRDAIAEKDDEIAQLREQLAAASEKRGGTLKPLKPPEDL